MRSEKVRKDIPGKMQIAWNLLKDGQRKIATIAHQLGYSHSHFSTVFRLHYHASPNKVRASFIDDHAFRSRLAWLIGNELKRLREKWGVSEILR
jgi:AraC-like DNA-binding protein